MISSTNEKKKLVIDQLPPISVREWLKHNSERWVMWVGVDLTESKYLKMEETKNFSEELQML